jgi:hypothetical protein
MMLKSSIIKPLEKSTRLPRHYVESVIDTAGGAFLEPTCLHNIFDTTCRPLFVFALSTHYIANILYIKRALFGKDADRCLIPCFRGRLNFFDLTVIHDHFEHFLFQERVLEKGHAVLILTVISL